MAQEVEAVAEKAYYIEALEKIWIEAEEYKHITFDNLIQKFVRDDIMNTTDYKPTWQGLI